MRQLGRQKFEDQPGRNGPSEQEAHRRGEIGVLAQGRHALCDAGDEKEDGREKQRRQEQEMVARPTAVPLMSRNQLGAQILAHRLAQESPVGGQLNGDQPRGGDRDGQERPRPPGQRLQPAGPSFPDQQGKDCQPGHHWCDRPLDQDAAPDRQPEHQSALAPASRPEMRQRRHRQGRQTAQHGVGLGDPAFDAQKDGRREKDRTCEGGLASDQALTTPEGGKGSQHHPENRRDAIGPDAAIIDVGKDRDGGNL